MFTHSLIDRRLFLVSVAALVACSNSSQPPYTPDVVHESEAEGVFGVVRYFHAGDPKSSKTPLVLLHPSGDPISGEYFSAFMLEMARDRFVLAPDTPGYGGSARPPEPQSMEQLAQGLLAGIEELGLKKVDIAGYHTGSLIAIELAVSEPDLVRKLILPGIPYFAAGEERDSRNIKYGIPTALTGESPATVANYAEEFPYHRWAYHAVFTYESEKKMPRVEQPVMIPHVSGDLEEESRAAAKFLPNVTLLDEPVFTDKLFSEEANSLAEVAREFLD